MPVVISTHPQGFFHKPFVYYAIEKCASSWIIDICLPLSSNEGMLRIAGGYNVYADQSRIFYEKSSADSTHNIPTAQTLHYYYSKLFLKNAFQFTFVRHPLDRFISSWIHGSISPEIGNFTNKFNSTMSTDEMILFFNKFVNLNTCTLSLLRAKLLIFLSTSLNLGSLRFVDISRCSKFLGSLFRGLLSL